MTINDLIVFIVLGVAAYLVDAHVPMSPPFKTVFRLIVVAVLVLFLLSLIGVGRGTRLF